MMEWHIRRGTSYEQYDQLVSEALNQCKIGGDPRIGKVLASLANAEARILTEPSEKLEVSGQLTIDN
jgi:hypothetical protein